MNIIHNVFDAGSYTSEYPTYYTPACVPTANPGIQVAAVRDKCEEINRLHGNIVSISGAPYTRVGTFLTGVAEIPEALKPIERRLDWRQREAGTHKEFIASAKNESMLLRDMIRGEVQISARPKIVAGSVQVLSPSANLNQYCERSPCHRNYWRMNDGNSYVNISNGLRFTRTVYNQATALPWPSALLRDLESDMRRILHLQEVNRSVVTALTAEANSSVMDLTTELAELPETVMMIVNALRAGIQMYRDTRDKVKRLPKNAVTEAASLWMAYRYGIQPIAYSVADMLDVLDHQTRKFQSFRSGVLEPLVDDKTKFSLAPQPEYVGRCFIKQRLHADTDISQKFRMNLVTTVWELIPLSFVVDWFFAIGDWLTSVFTPAMVADRVAQYSWRSSSTFSASYDGYESTVTLNAYRCEKIDPGEYRSILQPFWLNWKRQIDAASLLWLLTRRNPK